MLKHIETGTLRLDVRENHTGAPEEEIFDIAARANPKRGFLIVSKLIGRHLPTRPATMRETMRRLAERIPGDLPGPVLFLGMAETAVGLGQGVHDAWRTVAGRTDAWFLQSTRQTAEGMEVWATFEEGHSHATNHLVHVPRELDRIRLARSVVVVDDECSTGTTFIKVEEALRAVLPDARRFVDVVITEWSQDARRERVSLVSGTMEWRPNGVAAAIPGGSASAHGTTRPGASLGRHGYERHPRLHLGRLPGIAPGERITVVADGENSYDALCVAETCEAAGAMAAVQSITRSPAHVGGAMKSRAILSDAHGSGATCYSYNLLAHRPDRIIVVGEVHGRQREEIARETGLPLDRIHLVGMGR